MAESLLKRMIAANWQVSLADIHVSRWVTGQPHVTLPSGVPPLSISLSHCPGWVACAASEAPRVGIDIEVPKPGRDIAAIAAFAFGQKEQVRSAETNSGGFYRIWTLREAISKAIGEGLPFVADRSNHCHIGPENGSWIAEVAGANWHLLHRHLGGSAGTAYLSMAEEVVAGLEQRLTEWIGNLG